MARLILSTTIASLLVPAFASAALAQDNSGEIIVTARKREESILKVPVIETAIPQGQLDRLQVTDIADLPKLVAGLNIAGGIAGTGSSVAIRGVGTSSPDAGLDQSVSLNIDGMQITHGLAFQSGLFDVQQVEVLKGPQALFYGKSSPGGVISLRSADPTDRVEVIARAGYEFEARAGRGELIVSGPLTQTLKARVAGYYEAGQGYFENTAVAFPGTGAVNPIHAREPRPRDYMVRGTLLWNPTARLSARLKMNLVHDKMNNAEARQLVYCPEGVNSTVGIPFITGEDCKLNRTVDLVYMNPANFPGIINNGIPFIENDQKYGTLELGYDLANGLKLDSTTGYYHLRSDSLVNSLGTGAAGAPLAGWGTLRRRDVTQEIRINSSFSTPLNFTVGAFYQDGMLSRLSENSGNSAYGAAIGGIKRNDITTIDINAWSIFGQLRWKIVPQLELAGGVRWTDEKRSASVFNFLTGLPIPIAVNRIGSSNFSPEATLTYTPTDDLTLFASYKKAYKSGSFSIAAIPTPGSDISFGDEKVEGAEAGVKGLVLDRQVRFSLAGYDYWYHGLQVGAVDLFTASGQPSTRTLNAGSARTYGIDFDVDYHPKTIEGLDLHASVNWNRGHYEDLTNVPCWSGQTVALGCNGGLNPATHLYTTQDVSGTPLLRAPTWQATFGFDYEIPVGHFAVVLSNNNQVSSSYRTFLEVNYPDQGVYQDAFIKSDVSIALKGPDDRWEFAVIGKNIGDKVTTSSCSATNAQNGGLFGGQTTGGLTSGPAGLGESVCYSETGRSVWLRLTLRPFGGR